MEITERQIREATTFAKRLKLALQVNGVESPAAFASKIKVKRQTVYYWLDGTTKNPDSHHVERAAHELGVRSKWLLAGELPIFIQPEAHDEDEIQLVGLFQAMDPTRRKTLLEIAEGMAQKSGRPTAAAPYKAPPKTKANR